MRFGGRATVTVPPFVEAELGACLALLGGFFADMEGEGEDEEGAPFVWMPAGIGRFVFEWVGMTGGGMGVVLGAMATGALLQQTARCAAGEAPLPDAGAGAWCPVLVRSAWPASQVIATRCEGRGSIAFGQMEMHTAGLLWACMRVPEMGVFRGEMKSLTIRLWAVGCRADARSKNLVALLVPCSGRRQWTRPTILAPATRCDGDCDGNADDGSGLGWFRDGSDAVGGNRR